MAVHTRERILEAFVATLTGATTAGDNVHRIRVYPHTSVPALEVGQGSDEVIDDGPAPAWDRLLLVHVDIIAQALADPIESALNALAREVHVALLADVTQGESAIIDTVPVGDDEPEITADAERKTARLRMTFRAHYRTSVADPAT